VAPNGFLPLTWIVASPASTCSTIGEKLLRDGDDDDEDH